MARKEWIQLRRDPRSMVLAFALPRSLLLFFGYAISWDVTRHPARRAGPGRTAASRALVEAFEASGYFEVVARRGATPGPPRRRCTLRARVTGVLVIPPGFARDLAPRGRARAAAARRQRREHRHHRAGYADAIAARYSRDVLLQGRGGAAGQAEVRIWYNPTLESRNMIVPGLIAVIMSIIAAMLTALTIAREWERGTMEQLAATPVHRLEVVFGKLLPYLGIGVFDVAVTTVAGHAHLRRAAARQRAAARRHDVLFLLGALGLGMFISAVLRSQVLATQVAMVATYLPALLLSGFLFDIASMPACCGP
jgi:ABC-2 type transport system permease protein